MRRQYECYWRREESAFTLVELLVAIMLFSILMAMTVPIVLTLGGVFANATRNLTAQDQQILTSNELNRIIEGATAPPGTSSTFQAVYLVCPDAMIFYTNAPLPGEHAPNYGGWVYIYLTKNESLPNGQASYDLNVAKVGSYGAPKPSLLLPSLPPPGTWPPDGGSTSSWSSDCGPTQTPGVLTSQVIPPPSGNVFFSIDNVIASQPIHTSTTCWGLSQFFSFYSGQGSCTAQANQVGEVSYDIQVRDLVCGDHCTASDVSSTPSVTLRSMVIMPNVLLADGEGSGIF